MTKIIRYTILCLLCMSVCVACKKHSDMNIEPTRFNITFDTIRATSAIVSISPENKNAQYIVDILPYWDYNDDVELVHKSDQEIIDYEAKSLLLVYEDHLQNDPEASFSDIFLYSGQRTLRHEHLSSDYEYEYVVMQVNPSTRQLIGDVIRIPFTTPKIVESDIQFDAELSGSKIIIKPSNNDPYLVIIDRAENVYRDSTEPEQFVIDAVRLFEDYGFIESMICRGQSEIECNDMIENEVYAVIAVGYNGEINSGNVVFQCAYINGQLQWKMW